ncbi:MAG: class GN sortase [Betaproteobacteria bacterium]|nr:class GN sortase [Betaproteobacteria bacterium]
MRLKVVLDAGVPLARIDSAYHAITQREAEGGGRIIELAAGEVPANKDFELTWTPAAGHAPSAALFTEKSGDKHYALLMVMPPAKEVAAARLPREVIFVIDTSGSMSGSSIAQAKEALALAVSRLDERDSFNVIEFNSYAKALYPEARQAHAANRDNAVRFVRGLQSQGGTEMALALNLALNGRENPGRVRQVIFLTDGAVGNEDGLFKLIQDKLGDSRLFTVGIGSAPNSHFMTKAAQSGRGTFTTIGKIGEVKEKMGALFAKLESPVLKGIEIAWPAGTRAEAWPKRVPDLYLGEPIVVSAALDKLEGDLRITGLRGDTAWQATLPLGEMRAGKGMGVLWAREKIASLVDSLRDGAQGRRRARGGGRRRPRPSPGEQVHQPRRGGQDAGAAGRCRSQVRRRPHQPAGRLGIRKGLRRTAAGRHRFALEPAGRVPRPAAGERAVSQRAPRADRAWRCEMSATLLPLLHRRGEGGVSRSMLREAGRLCKAGSGARSGAGVRVGRPFPLTQPSPRRGEGKRSGEDWPLGVECAWPSAMHAAPAQAVVRGRIDPLSSRWQLWLAAVVLAFGLWQLGQGSYIQAKAWLAQVLIKQAWARTLDGEAQAKPWPWADTWPVARITVPDRGIERFVLAGANGRAIAFGPGHVFGTPLPGEAGNSVIGGHRDTHFAFLRDLRHGEEILVQKSAAGIRRYRVEHSEIVDKGDTRALAQADDGARLTLITCYPFDALRAGGPLRYVVTAKAI